VVHVFEVRNGLIQRFDIGDELGSEKRG